MGRSQSFTEEAVIGRELLAGGASPSNNCVERSETRVVRGASRWRSLRREEKRSPVLPGRLNWGSVQALSQFFPLPPAKSSLASFDRRHSQPEAKNEVLIKIAVSWHRKVNFPPSRVGKGVRGLGFSWIPDDLNCQKGSARSLPSHSLIFCRQLQLGGLPCCSW